MKLEFAKVKELPTVYLGDVVGFVPQFLPGTMLTIRTKVLGELAVQELAGVLLTAMCRVNSAKAVRLDTLVALSRDQQFMEKEAGQAALQALADQGYVQLLEYRGRRYIVPMSEFINHSPSWVIGVSGTPAAHLMRPVVGEPERLSYPASAVGPPLEASAN